MDMIYIYGVYHFFAFEICQAFLNDGYEVTGVPYSFDADDTELSLLIGRNANYKEWKENNSKELREESHDSVLFLSHYDHQYLNQEQHAVITKHLKEFIDHHNIGRTIVIIPREFTATSIREESFADFMNECKSIVPKPSIVAVPPLYGNGQPEQDVLYVLANSSRNSHIKIPNSTQEDALPSNEAAAFMVEKAFGHFENVLLKSDVKHHYKRCIEAVLGSDWQWSGVLKDNIGIDFSTFITEEVQCATKLERLLNEWSRNLKSPLSKNTFHV